MEELVTSYESAFVARRLIHENIIVADKAFHYFKTKRTEPKGECVVKIDMQKAYDRVKLGFLANIQCKLGFYEKWIKWIEICIMEVTYRVKLNGNNSPSFKPTRGLCQGTPYPHICSYL